MSLSGCNPAKGDGQGNYQIHVIWNTGALLAMQRDITALGVSGLFGEQEPVSRMVEKKPARKRGKSLPAKAMVCCECDEAVRPQAGAHDTGKDELGC